MTTALQTQLEEARARNAQPRTDLEDQELTRLSSRRAELHKIVGEGEKLVATKAEIIAELQKDLDAETLTLRRGRAALAAVNSALREVEHSMITRETANG